MVARIGKGGLRGRGLGRRRGDRVRVMATLNLRHTYIQKKKKIKSV